MKSLTFGTLPSFDEFKAAFDAQDGLSEGGLYEITMPEHSTDQQNFSVAGLLARGEDRFTEIGYHYNHVFVAYNAEQLYRLVENLIELSEIDEDEEFEKWARGWGSDIMSTLGFDWV